MTALAVLSSGSKRLKMVDRDSFVPDVQRASQLFKADQFSQAASLCQTILDDLHFASLEDHSLKSTCLFILSSSQNEMRLYKTALETLHQSHKESPQNAIIANHLKRVEEAAAHLLYVPEAVVGKSPKSKYVLTTCAKIAAIAERTFAKQFPSYQRDLAAYQEALSNFRLPLNLAIGQIPSMGKGVFLKADAPSIPPKTFIGFYAGEFLLQEKTEPSDSSYLWGLGEIDELKDGKYYFLDIDARKQGNFTRYINHSSQPNLTCHEIRRNRLIQVAIVTDKQISPGQQLLLDYGGSYWDSCLISPLEVTPDTYRLEP